MAIERYQPLLLGIDSHLTFHAVENPGLKRRRLKIRVRCEIECYEFPLTTGISEHKYVRQYPEQTRTLLCFLVARLLQFPLLIRMADEPLYALVLFQQLLGVKWVAINRKKLTERTILRLEDFLNLFPPGFRLFEPVHPVALLLALDFQFVRDHLPCQVDGRHFEPHGVRVGEGVRSEQNERHYDGCDASY